MISGFGSEELFARMCALYREWNAKINVISRKDIDNVYEHHILHSLGIAYYLKSERPAEYAEWVSGYASSGSGVPAGEALTMGISAPTRRLTVLDVGCGGGFPGIPLAAVFPEVQFTLCDSIGKKVRVAQEVAAALGLRNVNCVHSRVEDLAGPDGGPVNSNRGAGGKWDYIVSRAVTSLDNFLPWVEGRYNRSILYLKGGDLAPELDACRKKFGRRMPEAVTWNLSNVLEDEYFAEKLVVNLGISQK